MANSIGYAHLVETLNLPVCPPHRPAALSNSVNRRVDASDRIFFPFGVALTDTLLGHVEFALRHEGIDLTILAEVLPHIGRERLKARLRESPNGESIRRAAYLLEWFGGEALDAGVTPSSRYIDLFDATRYCVAANPIRNRRYRINDNALGDHRFCPIVHRDIFPGQGWLAEMLSKVADLARGPSTHEIYQRAVQYLYLSETKGSFAIERELPSANKEERFVQLLRRAAEEPILDEDRLVEIQNAAVRDVFSREASYRTTQNWLESSTGRVSFLPHPPESLRDTMAGWETFVNDGQQGPGRGIDPLVKAACASFGLVYIHPFMDGNGRAHRFVAHQVLAHSGLTPRDMIIPVSAVIMQRIPDYLAVLAVRHASENASIESRIPSSPGSSSW